MEGIKLVCSEVQELADETQSDIVAAMLAASTNELVGLLTLRVREVLRTPRLLIRHRAWRRVDMQLFSEFLNCIQPHFRQPSSHTRSTELPSVWVKKRRRGTIRTTNTRS